MLLILSTWSAFEAFADFQDMAEPSTARKNCSCFRFRLVTLVSKEPRISWSGKVGAVGLMGENGSLVMLEVSLTPEAYGESARCASSKSPGIRSTVLVPFETAVLLSLRLRVIGPLLCSRQPCSEDE